MAPGGASVSKFRKMGLKHSRNNSDVPCDCFIGEPNFGKLSSEGRTVFVSIFLSASDLVCGVRSVGRCTVVYSGFSIMPVSCVALSPIASSAELRGALTSPAGYGGSMKKETRETKSRDCGAFGRVKSDFGGGVDARNSLNPTDLEVILDMPPSPLSKVRMVVLVVSARHLFFVPTETPIIPRGRDNQEPLKRGPQEQDRGGVDFQNAHCSGIVSRVELHGDNSKSHALFCSPPLVLLSPRQLTGDLNIRRSIY